ncbi:conserved hypothetical protein [Methanocaldococcus jannaschii DSM 2661]|uniref:Uncharacterized protein MJ0015 n=1 Tax=Methanocaldococcus jannaschii (strain ATCC 43067 / DSM 2661 / JAL-1 / JCM 10045 / NBRC 100440) TaxID=243232 RepID=Y015_METJA|nr:RecName: Full=Uncharacterized protein MJ0015 [Methanocaldococcus jannaschii DSM 2661]AAB97993.1 conserved hypothetical protein [Methanocaldococcus jannaschii DSM 2661]
MMRLNWQIRQVQLLLERLGLQQLVWMDCLVMMLNKAIFLDRDGVINKRLIGDYVKKIEEFELLPNVREALIEFKKMGYLLIVVTNQQGSKQFLIFYNL